MKSFRNQLLIALALYAGAANALTVTFSIVHQYCGVPNGQVSAYASGGVPPYTYAWSNGSTSPELWNVEAGTYSLTVTDFMGTQATEEATVDGYAEFPNRDWDVPWAYCDPHSFATFSPWQFASGNYDLPIQGPISLGGVVTEDMGGDILVVVQGAPGSSFQTAYADGNGCLGSVTLHIGYPVIFPAMAVLNIEGACASTATGSLDVALTAEGHGQVLDLELKNSTGQVVQNAYSGPTAMTSTFTGLLPGDYWLVQRIIGLGSGPNGTFLRAQCGDSIMVTVPDLGPACGNVNGTVYMDNNADCVMGGSSETRVPGAILEFQPGPYYATAASNGKYSINLPTGAYTVEQIATDIAQHCPTPPAPVNVVGMQTLNIADTSLVPLDAEVRIASGPARPGFELNYAIRQSNLTPAVTGNTVTTFTFDPAITVLSSSPAGTVAGNTITWDQGSLSAFAQRSIQVRMQVPPDVGLIGTVLNALVVFSTANTDVIAANNTASTSVTVTGSFDPNDKVATTSSRASDELYFINSDERIGYTIRFQNTGTDTAFNVIVTDTLPATLDPASIQWGASSHAATRSLLGHGVLRFTFANIFLPDSNVNEAASHGFVSFRIKPRDPVVPGTTIENIANIFFDFNPPVITDPSILTVASPGVAISPRMLLGGPYEEATQRMSDGLRAAELIPFTEPYTALGYPHVNGGGETTTSAVLAVSGDDAIVDWVVVELRSSTAPYAVVATKSALLQRDGDVAGTSGTGPVFFNIAAGNYHVALRHRNHLGVMSNASFALGNITTVVDFSIPGTATYGTDAQATIGTRRALWAGDCQGDGELKYTGDNNDRDLILQEVGGVMPTATSTGYHREDANMDGTVKYTGADNDRDLLLLNIGGLSPTTVITEQLP